MPVLYDLFEVSMLKNILLLVFALNHVLSTSQASESQETFISIHEHSLLNSPNIDAYTDEGLRTMNYLASGGYAKKEYDTCKKSVATISLMTSIASILSSPTIIGPFLFGSSGVTALSITGACTLNSMNRLHNTLQLGQLIEASYKYNGYINNTTSEEKLLSSNIINKFIDQYVDQIYEPSVEDVSKMIVKANEKGWFGYLIPQDNLENQFISGKIVNLKDLHRALFSKDHISYLLIYDTTISQKIEQFLATDEHNDELDTIYFF